MRGRTLAHGLATAISLVILCSCTIFLRAKQQESSKPAASENLSWPAYGGGPLNDHFSPLAQINRANVRQLQAAWSFDTGEEGGLQTSPIIVDRVLYGVTPTQKVFALDAATGNLLWKFDSGVK